MRKPMKWTLIAFVILGPLLIAVYASLSLSNISGRPEPECNSVVLCKRGRVVRGALHYTSFIYPLAGKSDLTQPGVIDTIIDVHQLFATGTRGICQTDRSVQVGRKSYLA